MTNEYPRSTKESRALQVLKMMGIADTRAIAKIANLTPREVSRALEGVEHVVSETASVPAVYRGDPDHEFFRVISEFRARAADGVVCLDIARDLDVPMNRVRLILRTTHETYRALTLAERYRRVNLYRYTLHGQFPE